MIEQLFLSSSYVIHVENVMATPPQVLEIIFEVQRKRNNEKITRKINKSQTHKLVFFFFVYFSI
jgi:hypothetical protein